MTPEEFDQTLRSFLKRHPFFPFVVELTDGRRITIANPHVGFGGGVAGFLNDEGALDGFSCNEVCAISFATPEIAK